MVPTTDAQEGATVYINQQHLSQSTNTRSTRELYRNGTGCRLLQQTVQLSRSSQLPSGPLMQLSSSLCKQLPFMFLTVHRGLLMLLTLSGRGRLSHPPNRSTIQSKKTPDLYTEEEEEGYGRAT